MQNDYVKPPSQDSTVGQAMGATIRIVETARSLKVPVIYTRRIYRKDGLHSSRVHALKGLAQKPITIEGTWGAEIVEELKPQRGDIIIDKIRYSGFFRTPLETVLRGLGAVFVFMVGGSTHWGVEATARDAEQEDFIPIVVSDATHSTTDELQRASLRNISMFIGFVVSSEETIELLSQSRRD